MSLQGISEENKNIELSIMEELFKNIDSKQSIVFNSGAGAGKTYALMECLKYIVNRYGNELIERNQQVICITYTNVATNQIKKKLGNSDLVKVSTIHERIWTFIKQYKRQLVELHEIKIKREIQIIKNEIMTNEKYSFYHNLDEKKREKFREIIFKNKEVFDQAYTLGASEYRNTVPEEISMFSNALKNVGSFKILIGKLNKIQRLEGCLDEISRGLNKPVEYNAMYNQDRLEWMRISHDTVLEYGLLMVEKYPVLRQIIIDQYPYFLIDEYQDTAENVVKIMNLLDEYGKKIHHEFFVAYYGDMVQNIYGDGVGGKLEQFHKDLINIKKEFNRRSFQEIITVANRIRNDEIEQKSIYKECMGGTIKFYSGSQEDVDCFINYYVQKWNISKENPLHCFFTTNQLVVQYSGFLQFYESVKKTDAYSGARYEQLNTELLSSEPIKLGKFPRLLQRLMHLYMGLKQDDTPLREILLSEGMYDINIDNLRRLVVLLQERKGNTLDEFLQDIFKKYDRRQNMHYCRLIDIVFDIENASYLGVKKNIQEYLFPNENDEQKTEEVMNNLLNISMQELCNWYQYISQEKNEEKDKVYHTYHGTKGLEFENVIIVMGKGFGIQKKYFEDFFRLYDTKLLEEDIQLYENARNLLYVAVTRAIKNLRILYIDDVQLIEENVKKIFGEIGKVGELIAE